MIVNIGGIEYFIQIVFDFFGMVILLDMLWVGFNGQRIVYLIDFIVNLKGEDVNIGWYIIVKDFNSGFQVIIDELIFGEGGEFLYLDVLVNYLIMEKIFEVYWEDFCLVVMVGVELVVVERLCLFNVVDCLVDIVVV